jgi:hypothetical protein
MEKQNSNTFPIPLGLGWAINVIGWVVFVSTLDHTLETITGLLCVGCAWVGYKHKQAGTSPFLGIERLSAENLVYASVFEAIWMFAWALGLGSWVFGLF